MLFCAVEAMAESTIGRGPVTIDEIQEITRNGSRPSVRSAQGTVVIRCVALLSMLPACSEWRENVLTVALRDSLRV